MSGMRTKVPFSCEEDEQLIEHVGSYEYIWNMKHEDYKSGHKKDQVWQDIANKLGRRRDECQSRWKSIRDHFKRQRKEDIGSKGSAAKKKRASYWDRLTFLQETEDERVTFSNIVIVPESRETIHEDMEEDTRKECAESSETLPPVTVEIQEPVSTRSSGKRKIENIAITKYLQEKREQNKELNDTIKELLKCNDEDDVDLFFKSVALTVKKFRPTKLKILDIVSEMELSQNSEAPQIYNAIPNHAMLSASPNVPSSVITHTYDLCQIND